MDNEEINSLYRVWSSLMKMMQDREYLVPDELISRSIYRFKQMLQENQTRSSLNFELVRLSDQNSKILVWFEDNPRVTVPVISSIAQKMHAEGIERSIVIGKSMITPSASQAILEIRSHFVIEFFEDKEMIAGCSEEDSAQRHVILSEQEKEEFLDRFQIKETQMPKIDLSENVARYYGLLNGQILKMVKNTESSGKYFTYRIGS